MIMGLKAIHDANLCHRDIKPENILIGEYDLIKIADFGYASKLGILSERVGTPGFRAPEMLVKQSNLSYCGKKLDIFNMGAVLFTMVYGCMPFTSASDHDMYFRAIKDKNQEFFWKLHQ
jgi:serine/threonine protein kinase